MFVCYCNGVCVAETVVAIVIIVFVVVVVVVGVFVVVAATIVVVVDAVVFGNDSDVFIDVIQTFRHFNQKKAKHD